MKEIHEDDFKFIPIFCVAAMRTALLQPCPDMGGTTTGDETDQAPAVKVRLTDGAYG